MARISLQRERSSPPLEGLIERMVLASTDPGDLVVDPFAGSGTTLRVCQVLERSAIGIELNREYVDLIKRRLAESFLGFDSVDPRQDRTPRDFPKPLASHLQMTLLPEH